ncbi:hypothetical protein U2F26_13600 [Micromonospora sp. 4G57]|uniref:Uncharacterized protein n=1 Tax=Micromonospora sicca TaxID=2202420 RepID=A0ABU5JNY6_9ACTN|nr:MULTISPECIES: hypothetical protein [unclassified Micromonospora]MDZ5443762.1 hypothetical protein [Micromonospora sp. 4G57]MDZ5494306.1 hypothetical protein [Micromonospora sp. 4G53]
MRDNRPPYWRQRRVVEALGAGRDRPGAGGPDLPLLAPPRRGPAPSRYFTVHLGFYADDADRARELAVAYAEALSLLRPELALGAAALSPADAWQRAERLFCGAVGPDGERCADVAGHPGFHHAPGPGGLGWGDGDL